MALISTRSSAIPIDTLRSLHRLEAQTNEINNRLDGHDKELQDKLGKSNQDMLGVAAFVRGQLQAGGKVPLSITGLGGLAAQPQFAAVPQYSELPALAKAEGALSVSNGQLYYFQGASSVSSTPQWVPLNTNLVIFSTHADRANHVASTADDFYYETDRTVLYLANGNEWVYVAGTMLDVVANQPVDLGGADAGFQFLGTDDHTLYLWDGAAWRKAGSSGGNGPVTSVGLSMPSEFTVTGSPVTSAGTFGVTKTNQLAHTVYAGPASGGAAAPTFRVLSAGDMPAGITAQVNADWAASSGVAQILNKPPITWDGTTTTVSSPLAVSTLQGVGFVSTSYLYLQGQLEVTGEVLMDTTLVVGSSGAASGNVFRVQTSTGSIAIGGNSTSGCYINTDSNQTITVLCPLAVAGVNKGLVLAGPVSGGAGTAVFRALQAADLPSGLAPQVNADWTAASGVAQILNKPPITYDGSTTTTVTGKLTVTGIVNANSSLIVTGVTNLNNNVSITGAVAITGGSNLQLWNAGNTQSLTIGNWGTNPTVSCSTGSIDSNASVRFLNTVGAAFFNSGNTQSMSVGFNGAQPTINSTTGNVTIPCNLTVTGGTGVTAIFNLPGATGSNVQIQVIQPGTSTSLNIGVSNNIANGTAPYLYTSTGWLNVQGNLYVTGVVSATAHNTHASGSTVEELHAAFKRNETEKNEFGETTEHVVPVGGWNWQLGDDGMHLVVKRSETEIVEFVLPWESSRLV